MVFDNDPPVRGLGEVSSYRLDMLDRLNDPKNVAKGSWRRLGRWRLLWLLTLEVFELWWAVFMVYWREADLNVDPCPRTLATLHSAKADVRREAADVGVMAMFCSDVVSGAQRRPRTAPSRPAPTTGSA